MISHTSVFRLWTVISRLYPSPTRVGSRANIPPCARAVVSLGIDQTMGYPARAHFIAPEEQPSLKKQYLDFSRKGRLHSTLPTSHTLHQDHQVDRSVSVSFNRLSRPRKSVFAPTKMCLVRGGDFTVAVPRFLKLQRICVSGHNEAGNCDFWFLYRRVHGILLHEPSCCACD